MWAAWQHFWQIRVMRWRARWAEEAGFRYSLSLFIAALALLVVGIGMLIGLSVAEKVSPRHFAVQLDSGNGQNGHYPIARPSPIPAQADPPPIAVATSPLEAPTEVASPTPTPSPTLTVTATPTFAGLACPALGSIPPLSGSPIADGVDPTPLSAGCPAQLLIAAGASPHAPIDVALTFGTTNLATCTVPLAGKTDGAGNATLTFTVPAATCFQGNIFTSGHVTVGGDSSATARFPAVGG